MSLYPLLGSGPHEPTLIPIPAPIARTPPSAIIVSQKQVRFRFSGGESSFGTCNIRFGSSLSALVSTVVIISLWIETTSLAGIPSMSLAFLDDALDMDPLLMKNKLSSCINFWIELKMEGLEGKVIGTRYKNWTLRMVKVWWKWTVPECFGGQMWWKSERSSTFPSYAVHFPPTQIFVFKIFYLFNIGLGVVFWEFWE